MFIIPVFNFGSLFSDVFEDLENPLATPDSNDFFANFLEFFPLFDEIADSEFIEIETFSINGKYRINLIVRENNNKHNKKFKKGRISYYNKGSVYIRIDFPIETEIVIRLSIRISFFSNWERRIKWDNIRTPC